MTPSSYSTVLPLRLVNPTNERGHWGKDAARARKQVSRVVVRMANAMHRGLVPQKPWRVTLTRLFPARARPMDEDNLAAACKHVQDGVAKSLGVDDGSKAYSWVYAQERADEYGVRITIEHAPLR